MKSFVFELRRRNVLRVAAAYALVAWIFIEAGSVLLPTFGAPDWFFATVYVPVAIGGFVVAMIIAWVFEITPEGVRLESDVDRSSYDPPPRGRTNVMIIALLVVALGVSLTFNLTGLRDRAVEAGDVPVRDSIAVLPFTSRSSDEENRYFADGIHDDILTRLAEVDSLRVISRTSVNKYRDPDRNLRDIGKELGVATIVEGAVQRSGNQVRITVQLIDAATDEHLWAETYDREFTIQNVFELQSEISGRIAGELRAALTPEDEFRLARIPTENVAAYAEYVKARDNLFERNYATLELAREQFESAIDLDPEYAQAYAGLAETVLVLYANHKSIPEAEAFRIAGDALEKALAIDPDLAEAHAVRGLLHMSRWELDRTGSGNVEAARAYDTAIKLNPNLASAYIWFSSLRRAEGDNAGAVELLTTALTIDPLSRIPYVNLPSLLAAEGQTTEATALLLGATNIFPDWEVPYEYLSVHLQKLGRLDEAVAWGLRAGELSADPLTTGNLLGIYQAFGDDDAITAFVEAFPAEHSFLPLGRGYWHYITRDYAGAKKVIDGIENLADYPRELVFPLVMGVSLMTRDYDRAYDALVKASPGLAADDGVPIAPHNVYHAVMLAFVEIQRGNRDQAAGLLARVEPVLREMPRFGLSGHGIQDVHVLMMQGRRRAAMETLIEAVDEGFVISQGFDAWPFDEDPILAPLRSDPRYEPLRQRMQQRLEAARANVAAARAADDWSGLLALAGSG